MSNVTFVAEWMNTVNMRYFTVTETIPETPKRHKEFLQHTHAQYKRNW